ncbi:hypothetical protein HRI_001534000 [Hibiscus trionum]|uniref:Uncharacterized protein n=1 Tax=Hibiscus trionum TaxID=183268 RepID=A0A9W7LV01_HIBTR|nr:hypothetical protein HRI_001534000 [Hibiscus trionum]
MGFKSMDEISVVVPSRFGDQRSTLLDQFERLSFEIHLNQAILARSLSEPTASKRSHYCSQVQAPVAANGRKGRRGSGFNRVLKKLLKPILGWKGNGGKKTVADPKDPSSWKSFSRSLRF